MWPIGSVQSSRHVCQDDYEDVWTTRFYGTDGLVYLATAPRRFGRWTDCVVETKRRHVPELAARLQAVVEQHGAELGAQQLFR